MLKLLSYIYYLVTSFRNFLYDHNIASANKVKDVTIICIGNITVGGTGKTPAVQYFVKKLTEAGHKVAVVSRGYRGKRKRDPLLVSDGRVLFAAVSESGDESYMHALNLNVPVIVSKNRYKGCQFAKKHFGVDVIVLDDGFQHRKLKRDWDIVLIDATNPFGYGALLPKGRLREDLKKGLARASEFILTKSDLVNEHDLAVARRYLSLCYRKNVSLARHGITSLCDIHGNQKPLFWLKDQRLLLFSGLANPLNFEKTVISLSPEYIERIDFLDHHKLTESDMEMIEKRASAINAAYIVTTEKDMVKLPPNTDIYNLLVLKVNFVMIEDNTLKGLEFKNAKEKGNK